MGARRGGKSLEVFDAELSPQRKAQRKRSSALGLLALAGLMGLFALGGIIFTLLEARKMTGGGAWPTTTAAVVDAAVNRINVRGPDVYQVLVYVEFTLGARTVRTHVTLEQGYDEGGAAQVAQSYLRGGTATVWYDPVEPARESLSRVGFEFIALPAGATAVALLGCLLIAWFGRHGDAGTGEARRVRCRRAGGHTALTPGVHAHPQPGA